MVVFWVCFRCPFLPPMSDGRLRAVKVPQGTIYGLDVDPTNKYIVTAGQVTTPAVA